MYHDVFVDHVQTPNRWVRRKQRKSGFITLKYSQVLLDVMKFRMVLKTVPIFVNLGTYRPLLQNLDWCFNSNRGNNKTE